MNHEQFLQEINALVGHMIAFLPKLILALLVFLLGLLIARIAEYLVRRLMNYLSRQINERFGDQVQNINFAASGAVMGKVFYWIILFFFVIASTEILGFTIITSWLGRILHYSPNILAAILIVFAGIIAGRVLSGMIASLMAQMGIAQGKALGKIVYVTIVITSLIIAIDQVGIDIVFLTQTVGIILAALLFGAALAFGLGAKTSVSNILASYYVNKIYTEGDLIRVGDMEGRIIKIDSTAVILDTKEGRVAIPAKLFNELKSVLIIKDE